MNRTVSLILGVLGLLTPQLLAAHGGLIQQIDLSRVELPSAYQSIFIEIEKVRATGARPVVIMDVDGTLYDGDIPEHMLRFIESFSAAEQARLLKASEVDRLEAVKSALLKQGWITDELRRHGSIGQIYAHILSRGDPAISDKELTARKVAYTFLSRYMSAFKLPELSLLTDHVLFNHIFPHLYLQQLKLIQELKKSHCTVVWVSASPDPIITRFRLWLMGSHSPSVLSIGMQSFKTGAFQTPFPSQFITVSSGKFVAAAHAIEMATAAGRSHPPSHVIVATIGDSIYTDRELLSLDIDNDELSGVIKNTFQRSHAALHENPKSFLINPDPSDQTTNFIRQVKHLIPVVLQPARSFDTPTQKSLTRALHSTPSKRLYKNEPRPSWLKNLLISCP